MEIRFRDADEADLPAIVRLLVDDDLSGGHDAATDPLDPAYAEALREMGGQPGNRVVLVEGRIDDDWIVVGCSQFVTIAGLSRKGMKRAQLEHVRVASDLRGQGVGRRFMEHLLDLARAQGCGLVQLMAGDARVDAHHFYESLGFRSTHQGFKFHL